MGNLDFAADYLARLIYGGLSDKHPQLIAGEPDNMEHLYFSFLLRSTEDEIRNDDFAALYLNPVATAVLRSFRQHFGSWHGINCLENPPTPLRGTGATFSIGLSNPPGIAVLGVEGYDALQSGRTFSFGLFISERTQ